MKKKHLKRFQFGGNLVPSLYQNNQNPFGVDYAEQFRNNTQPVLNQMRFQAGLATSTSQDPMIAIRGKAMMDDSINGTNNAQLLSTDSPQSKANLNWEGAISSLGSRLASSLPGQAGQIGQNVANAGTNIYRSVQALKGLKGQTGVGKLRAGNVGSIVGSASDLVGSFLPEKQEYSGPKGDITQTMDSVYDGISDAAMSLGPVGMLVGGIMKGGALLGKGMNALGGGTDGMTTTDAILGSSFLNLTPFGLINGFGGSKADTITKDNQAFETVGSSYTGSNQTIDDALQKSGKKYGLFSQNAKNKANEEIANAKNQQFIISNIADDATTRFAIRNSMSAINGNKRAFNMQGGYNQADVQVGRNGLKINPYKVREILKRQTGGQLISDPFQVYYNSLPKNQKDSANFRVRDYWEFNGRPKNFKEAVSKKMFELRDDYDDNGNYLGKSWHAFSVSENPSTGEIEFMKSPNHPTVKKEIEWYNSDKGAKFRSEYELVKSSPYWKYVKRTVSKHKDGGSLIEIVLPTDIEITIPETIPEFQKGGSVNVIPDGALHARKHNMDIEGITKKGIPVVDNDDKQQAEVEKEEIIFRLEVTQKLEELEKKYFSEDIKQKEKDEIALEAGKLLTEEILHNTQDNTNNILNGKEKSQNC